MSTDYKDFIYHRVIEVMELWFKGAFDRSETEYGDKDISEKVQKVLKENPWENFIRTYDLRDKIVDKCTPVLNLLPDDIDPEYMWITDDHMLVCIDDIKLIDVCYSNLN